MDTKLLADKPKLGTHTRKGEGLQLCVGKCGRLTRPSYMRLDQAPDTVIRWKEGYCPSCWEVKEAERPMTERERLTEKALNTYMRQRRVRLERMERMGGIEKFFPDIPDFGDKEKPSRPSQLGNLKRPLEPRKRIRPNRGNDNPKKPIHLHDARGDITMDYHQAEDGGWVYTIREKGAILEVSRPYKALSNARRYARTIVDRRIKGMEPTFQKRVAGMSNEDGFREGAVRYLKDSEGKWRFSIVGANGEVMAQSEAYAHLYNAKRGARKLVERLQIEEPDE